MPDTAMPKLPEMLSVVSSNIAEVGHDGEVMYVRFKGKDGGPGALYRSTGIPDGHPKPHHKGALAGARSPGAYYNEVLKTQHVWEKVG